VAAFFLPKKKEEKPLYSCATAAGIVNIETVKPGFLECMDKCIWLAFLELSGARAYAKMATRKQSTRKLKLKTPKKFFLNFRSAIVVNPPSLL